jgi:hypothetical protein
VEDWREILWWMGIMCLEVRAERLRMNEKLVLVSGCSLLEAAGRVR